MTVNPGEKAETAAAVSELVRQSSRGDRSAFRRLMESHERYAYALAFRLLREEDASREIVLEAFIRVWNNLDRFRPEVKFTTWLYKIVVNLCYDRMKMDARRHTLIGRLSPGTDAQEIAGGNDPHAELERRELRDCILVAARKLPPMERLIFHLRDLQDFTVEETSAIAGVSIASVKTNLCYARKRLRLALAAAQKEEQ